MDFGQTVSSVGASITSPAKLAFVGYVVLAYHRDITVSTFQFISVALVFFLLQVMHDDYLRIRLNKKADLQADIARQKALPTKP